MYVETAITTHLVYLGDGGIVIECLDYGIQMVGIGLNLQVAGDGSVDFLWIDDGRIFFYDSFFLQSVDPAFYRHPGESDDLTDLGLRITGIFCQKR